MRNALKHRTFMKNKWIIAAGLPLALFACNSEQRAEIANSSNSNASSTSSISPVDGTPYEKTVIADLENPWAMAFLPDGRLLITEKSGSLILMDITSDTPIAHAIEGVPEVADYSQGGLGDIILAPDFAESGMVYLSWAEAGKKTGDKKTETRGAVVGRAKLLLEGEDAPKLTGMKIIWKQSEKVTGGGHYSHRMAFSPDGKYLFISSGERQKFDPAQDMNSNLGKIVRLYPDGSVPEDNPFYDKGGVTAQIWTLGNRNVLGLAFDSKGQLWAHEMGPAGGDELNLVQKGKNYGYPIVSNGDHYDGKDIPDHDTRPEFEAPKLSWNPSISPAGMMIYSGDAFPDWKGNIFMGALSGMGMMRIDINGDAPKEADFFQMDARIREVEQDSKGNIWILEDGKSEGRLLRLSPLK